MQHWGRHDTLNQLPCQPSSTSTTQQPAGNQEIVAATFSDEMRTSHSQYDAIMFGQTTPTNGMKVRQVSLYPSVLFAGLATQS